VTTHPAAAFARELVAALAVHGVEDFVLCPGSRSGPLAHALAEASSAEPPIGAPTVSLHVRVDERSAAFLALGIARGLAAVGNPRPVAVVTTSGTAVGNLLPAVMEAHHGGVPLVLITADRPAELLGVGANQTTDQVGIFGTFVRWSAEVAAPAEGEGPGRATRLAARAAALAMGDASRDDTISSPGAVHLNVEFRDPLGPDGGEWPEPIHVEASQGGATRVPLSPHAAGEPLPPVVRGVVIAGDGAGDAARLVAEINGWPLFAEPTSGARAGDACVPGYVAALAGAARGALADRVEQVVVVGRPTLTRPGQALIARAPALYVAAHGARWREAPRHALQVLPRVPRAWLTRPDGAPPATTQWIAEWRSAADLDISKGWGPRAIAAAWIAALGPEAIAVLGSSGPIRAVDLVAPAWIPGRAPHLLANRGLAGIDGTVSTAIGVALGSRRPVEALIGDVTFLHDVGGLLIGPMEKRPNVRIVVVNDGGGTIFSSLEHANAPEQNVARVFTTPHGVSLGAVCEAYGVRHTLVTSVAGLAGAMRREPNGLEVVEAVVE